MKLLKYIFLLLVIAVVLGFGYFAFTDITVQQEAVTKDIPTDRFL